MELLIGYLLVVGTISLVIAIAAWPLRPQLVLLLLTGPAISALAAREVWPFRILGWIAVLGVAYLYLLLPPLIAWRRRWARYLVPAACLSACAGLVAFGGGWVMAVYLTLPILCAGGALVVAMVSSSQ